MIDKILSRLNKYPEFMSPSDLVELGLFSSSDAAYHNRRNGTGPSYIKQKHKILYPKTSVLDFIEKNLKDGSVPKNKAIKDE